MNKEKLISQQELWNNHLIKSLDYFYSKIGSFRIVINQHAVPNLPKSMYRETDFEIDFEVTDTNIERGITIKDYYINFAMIYFTEDETEKRVDICISIMDVYAITHINNNFNNNLDEALISKKYKNYVKIGGEYIGVKK